MIKELVLASWPNVEDYLFIILVLIKRYSIDDKGIHFVKGDRYALFGNPDHPDGTSIYHEYYCIHDDLFYRILETGQNSDIILKVIHEDP